MHVCKFLRSAFVAPFVLFIVFPVMDAQAEGEFFSDPELFIRQVFHEPNPQRGMIWLSGETRDIATELLGHQPDYLRLRYWGDANRSAWIVDEIGKTEPITIGIVVQNDSIEDIKVLAFRESRGWEIKHDFFTRQYIGASLTNQHSLSQNIDGISGATLSVRAMNNVSRLVLFLAKSLAE